MSFRPAYGFWGLLVVALVLGIGPIVNGSSITLFTGPGATDSAGEPVDGSAKFDISADTVKITLNNLIVNQKSIGQNISDVLFSLSDGATSASLTSSSGMERTVASDGTFSDGSTVATNWEVLSDTPGLIHLSVIGTPEAPKHTIIGAPDAGGTYSNANDSIAKTGGPHNPFLTGAVTFTLDVPGVTTSTTIKSALLSFGTTPGDNVPLPLPASAVGGLLLMGGLWTARKFRKA